MAIQKHSELPVRVEMIQGKLLWTDDERLQLLGTLLEQVGAREAVRLGDPEIWRTAVAELQRRCPVEVVRSG
jgi:hypothetical protein